MRRQSSPLTIAIEELTTRSESTAMCRPKRRTVWTKSGLWRNIKNKKKGIRHKNTNKLNNVPKGEMDQFSLSIDNSFFLYDNN